MAMTKKERAEFDAAIAALRVKGALRWTDKVEPDLLAPDDSKHFTQGWTFNSFNGNVVEQWSERSSHGDGRRIPGQWRQSASQGSINLFSTKTLALKAARHEMEQQFARKLADIDAKIEEASNG